MEVDLFIPCYIDMLFPDTGFNVVKVLEKAGCKVHYNPNQTCCGQPAFNAGYKNEAFRVAKKFLADYKGNRYIVCPSSSCIKMVTDHYEDFFINSSQRTLFKKIQSKAIEFSSFLTDVLKIDDLGASFPAKVTYHDSCSALRGMGIKTGPRKLLEKVKGLELIEMNESETCCGFGGTFSIKMEPISSAMADQKVGNALATGAEYIVGTDISCLMHLDGYLKKQKKDLKVMHLADVLAQGY
ncbi:(Fe-S)-binding protein [Bacteroidota bacterium]